MNFYRFRIPSHHCPYSTFLNEEKVLRGPFYKKKTTEIINCYQHYSNIFSKFSDEEIYIPKIEIINEKEYLVYPICGEITNIDHSLKLVSCKSKHFIWESSSEDEKLRALYHILIRYILGIGEGSFSNIFLLGSKTIHMNMDIPKYTTGSGIINICFKKEIEKIKNQISTFMFEHYDNFYNFLFEVEKECNIDEKGKCQYLFQMLISRNILKTVSNGSHESEKAKRGPKPKIQTIQKDETVSRYKNLPTKLNFDNCKVENISIPRLNFNFGCFLCAFNSLSYASFKKQIYTFVLEYFSIEEILKNAKKIVRACEKENPKIKDIVGIYQTCSSSCKNQELFCMAMKSKSSNIKNVNWSHVNSLEPPSFIKKMMRVMPHSAILFYLLMKKYNPEIEKKSSFKKIDMKLDTKIPSLSAKNAKMLLYSSLISPQDMSLSISKSKIQNPISISHVPFLNDEEIRINCQKLLKFKLNEEPLYLYLILDM